MLNQEDSLNIIVEGGSLTQVIFYSGAGGVGQCLQRQQVPLEFTERGQHVSLGIFSQPIVIIGPTVEHNDQCDDNKCQKQKEAEGRAEAGNLARTEEWPRKA